MNNAQARTALVKVWETLDKLIAEGSHDGLCSFLLKEAQDKAHATLQSWDHESLRETEEAIALERRKAFTKGLQPMRLPSGEVVPWQR